MLNFNARHLSIFGSAIFSMTLLAFSHPANALTLRIGTNTSTSFNTIKQINDNGVGDKNANSNILNFEETINGFYMKGVVTADIAYSDFEPDVIDSVYLKLSQFTLKNVGATTAASPIIRFENLFSGASFTSDYLSAFSLFDGSFASKDAYSYVAKTTKATYRTFLLPANNPGNVLGTSVTSYVASSGNVVFDSPNYNFKQYAGIETSNQQVNNQFVVGEVQATSLGSGETLSLPNSSCTTIFNRPLSTFRNHEDDDDEHEEEENYRSQNGSSESENNNLNFAPAESSCHPPESPQTSVPENSSALGILVSGIVAAGCLINQKKRNIV